MWILIILCVFIIAFIASLVHDIGNKIPNDEKAYRIMSVANWRTQKEHDIVDTLRKKAKL